MRVSSLGPLIVSGTFFVSLAAFLPLGREVELNPDEGLNLIKALLVGRGHALYSEIWSDQPPLFTHLLAFVLGLASPPGLAASRLVVLAFSSALLGAAFFFLRTAAGDRHAVVGTWMLLLLPDYLQLSVSVMIGLPSLALAMLSLAFLAAWHRHGRWLFLHLSAGALAASILTKGFTALLVPIVLVGLAAGASPRRRRWVPAALWASDFLAAMLGGLLLLVGPENLPQLVSPHWAARRQALGDGRGYGLSGWEPVLVLALVGGVVALRTRKPLLLYPAAWVTVAYIVLSRHAPLWFHQMLLLTVPAGLVVGFVLVEGVTFVLARLPFRPRPIPPLAIALAALGGFPLVVVPWVTDARSNGFGLAPPADLLVHVRRDAPRTRFMLTDRPIFAFLAGLRVPPPLAVLSQKRVDIGDVTEQDLIRGVTEYEPEQVLLARFHFPGLEKSLQPAYDLAFEVPGARLYRRRPRPGAR